MAKGSSIFKPIDEFIFTQVDALKNSPQFQTVLDQLDALTDDQKKLVYQGFSITFIVLPLFILLFVWLGNHGLRNELELKSEIMTYIEEFNQKKSEVATIGRSIISSKNLNTKADLLNALTASLARSNVDTSKINVSKFENIPTSDAMNKVLATINFSRLSTQNFSSLLDALLVREKMKVEKINVAKNPGNNTLSGMIDIIQFGRAQKND